MVSRRFSILILASVLGVTAGESCAQEPRIEQARQFEALSTPLSSPGEGVTSVPMEVGGGLGDDGFGIQQLLREQVQLRPFRVFADISAFATSNVALTRKDPVSDTFLLATLGFEYQRPLLPGLQIDAGLRIAGFRYNEFHQLNFNSIDAGLGVTYHASKLGGIDLFLRYNFNELFSAETDDAFFKNHTVTLGAQKAFVFSRVHYAFAGIAGQIGFADPKIAERSELSAFAGYHLQVTRNLGADLLYRYTYYGYSENSRVDHNQTLSFGLRYRFTDWFSASASAFVGWNRSNLEVFDYEVANGGVGLALSLQF